MSGFAVPLAGYYVECRNEGCREAIPLHPAGRLTLSRHSPGASPLPVSEAFTCPTCLTAYEYTALQVRPREASRDDPFHRGELIMGLVIFDCQEKDCDSRITIQKPIPKKSAGQSALSLEASHWKLVDIHCPKGHSVAALPASKNYWVSFWTEK